MSKLDEARGAYNAAVTRMTGVADEIEALDEKATDEDISALETSFDEAKAEVERCRGNMDRAEMIAETRASHAAVEIPEAPADEVDSRNYQVAKGSLKQEATYRPDTMLTKSFFGDLLSAKEGDRSARERLDRNNAEALDAMAPEVRDMQNLSTQGTEFVPIVYLNDLWVHPNIAGRPFADALPKYPLPPIGTTLSLPALNSGVSVAGRADAGTVSETDGVTASITHDVNELAGQVDIGRITVMRSDPGLDQVIGATLVRRYNAQLDTYCLSGTGTAPQHMGIRAVSSVNTVTYTQATPTAALTVPKIYDAIQKIASNRFEVMADTIVMHPRRAAWLASNLSSTFPLFQQGGLYQAAGTQDNGFNATFAGLDVILDPNVGILYGASTTEDEIYVVCKSDLYLAEGPLQARVFDDVGSGNGLIRYQVFAHSSFLSKRYPKSISVISGTGLIAPTF